MKVLILAATLLFATTAMSNENIDELNPFDANIESQLNELDKIYGNPSYIKSAPASSAKFFESNLKKIESTNSVIQLNGSSDDSGDVSILPIELPTEPIELKPELPPTEAEDCYRLECKVYARIIRSEQKLFLYVDGQLVETWDVSTGKAGFDTPNFDKRPNGRIYDRYSSSKFPGGDWNGYGNMPFAIFIEGGFAVHGTTNGNIPRLGKPASHGCVRMHPENARVLNRLVRQHGIDNTWISVEE